MAMQIVLQPLSLGTSNDLVVGQHVYALGNPFGLDHSLTTGRFLFFHLEESKQKAGGAKQISFEVCNCIARSG